jgi:CDP-diacylglycerol--glycerol-3-phosphate 3-phosphatidyltransferase
MLIPLVLIAAYMNTQLSSQIAALLFTIASITDYFDGWLARRMKLESSIGRFLDPIADKLLVGAVIVLLVHVKQDEWVLVPGVLIVLREILVSGLREFLAEINVSVPVSRLAKVKTTAQMLAIFLLLLGDVGSGLGYVDYAGTAILWIAAILTLVTGYAYLRAGIKHMMEN